jgi:uncharacterized protein (TIGR02246 family)
MRRAVTAAVLALTLVAGACSGPTGPEFTKADGQAIRQAASDHVTAFNAKDMDKVLASYADNSVFMPPNAPLLRGREPLKAYYNGLFERGGQLEMEVDEVNGHGPLAYETGTYTIQYTTPTATRDRGKFVRVLRSTNGKWLTEKMIWSSDLPKPAGD